MSKSLSKSALRRLCLSLALGVGWLGTAQAAINPGVTFTLYSDGAVPPSENPKAGFDPVAGPGFDTDAHNGLVRTNDTLTYRVSFNTSASESGIVITETLPADAPVAWAPLPAYCLTGSSIVGKTVTCKLGTITHSGTTDIDLTATVLSTAPNGATLAAPTLSMTSVSGPAPAPVTTPAAATVSAAPFYDIVVKNSYLGNPKAFGYMAGGGPNNQDGVYERPLVGLVAHNPNGYGNKGVEQLTGPITINIDLSGMPAGTVLDNWHNGNATDGTPAATGSFASGCGNPAVGAPSTESGGNINMYGFVNDSGAVSTLANTVPNGGSCAVSSSGTNGIVTMTINGADSSLSRRPSVVVSTGAAVPETDWWILNKALVLWTPLTSYPANIPVNNTIKLSSFSGTSITKQPMQNVNVDLVNYGDSFTYPFTNLASGSAQKIFTPDPSLESPYSTIRDPNINGDNYVNYMTPGQTVRGRVVLTNNGTTTFNNVTTCEIIDRTVFDIGSNFGASSNFSGVVTPPAFSIEYGVRKAGRYFATTDSATPANLTVINAPGSTSAYSSATCNDAGITWYPTAAEAGENLVYVRASYPALLPGTTAYLYVQGLILRSTYAATISTISPSAVTHNAGDTVANGTLIRNVGRISAAGVSTSTGQVLDNMSFNDHLQVVTMKTTSRVTKSVVVVDGKAPSSTNPAPTLPGSTVTYSLTPTYGTTFPPTARTFTVTDILPPGLSYDAGSATVGGAAGEPQVSANTPATGYTRLVWTYLNRQPAQVTSPPNAAVNLPEIRFNAAVGVGVANNTTLTNAVAVSGGGVAAGTTDDYDADCTYNTTTAFGACVKSATASIVVQTTPGFRIQKTTATPTIEPGQPFSFDVSYASFGQTMYTADIPDVIDILPYTTDGVSSGAKHYTGRSPSSSFGTGAYQLTGVTVPSNDSGMTVYYAATPPSSVDNDPRDSSNDLATGTTKWCLASSFGTAGCPTTLAQVTAVRLHPGVSTMNPDTLYTTTFAMKSTGVATAGNVFNNSVGAHSLSSSSTLQQVEAQAQSPVRVVTGSLAGQVFTDVNQNGTLDSGSDVGLAGVCITLTGNTGAGAAVTASTLTKADGTYNFTSGASAIYSSADCTGAAISSFGGLISGTYSLTEKQPANINDGKDYAGTLGGTVGSDTISAIPLSAGQSGTGYNFTELPLPLSIAKTVDTPYITVTPTSNATGTPLSYAPATQQLTYTLAVTNPGGASVGNVVMTDNLPSTLNFVKATLDGAALTPSSTSPLTFTLPSIAASTTKNVLVTVSFGDKPITPNTNQSQLVNTASLSASGTPKTDAPTPATTDFIYTRLFKQVHNLGPNPAANIPQATPAWTDLAQTYPGDTLEYCIDFYNYGSVPLNNYSVTDKIPANTKVVDQSWRVKQGTMQAITGDFAAPATVGFAGNTVTASGITLGAGKSGVMCFRTTIN